MSSKKSNRRKIDMKRVLAGIEFEIDDCDLEVASHFHGQDETDPWY